MGIGGPAKAKAETYLAARTGKMGHLRIRGPAGATVSIEGHVRARLPRDRAVVVFPGKVRLHVEKTEGASDVEVEAKAGVETDVALDEKRRLRSLPRRSLPFPRRIAAIIASSGGCSPRRAPSSSVSASTACSSPTRASIATTRSLQAPPIGCTVTDDFCRSPVSEAVGDRAQLLSDQNATWHAVRTTGIITGIVGAGAAITGVVLVVTSKSKPSAIGPEVSVLPGAAYFGLRGAF